MYAKLEKNKYAILKRVCAKLKYFDAKLLIFFRTWHFYATVCNSTDEHRRHFCQFTSNP